MSITPICPFHSCYETWEMTYQSQLCVNKYIYQALYQMPQTTKMKYGKLLSLPRLTICILHNNPPQLPNYTCASGSFLSYCVRKGSLYEGSDRILKAGGSINIHNNPQMTSGAIRKQKYTDSMRSNHFQNGRQKE